jgi:hypothetical protein
MKTLILCNSLYGDIESLSNLISTMEYEDNVYGSEIKDFNFIPQGIDEQFKNFLSESVEVQPNTGVFRKPNTMIHFEPFYQHCLWVGIVALEDTTLTLWEQENVKTIFDVPQEEMESFLLNNCNDPSKWSESNKLNIKKNDFVFIRPWLWHSLEENKLVQVFLLNRKLQEEDIDAS